MTRDEFLEYLTDYATGSILEHGKTLPTLATLHTNGKVGFTLMTGMPAYEKARALMRTLGATFALEVEIPVVGVALLNEALMQMGEGGTTVGVLNITVRCDLDQPDRHRVFRIHRRGDLLDLRPVQLPSVKSEMSGLLDVLVAGYRAGRHQRGTFDGSEERVL